MAETTTSRFHVHWLMGALALTVAAVALVSVTDPLQARAAALIGCCLVLWLGEVVPPVVPTLVLLAGVPLLLSGLDPSFTAGRVYIWAADPVLALFFGGFALGVGAQRHGLDAILAGQALRWSGGHRCRLLFLIMAATVFLSMWISNIAAAAMMIAATRPMLSGLASGDRFRTAVLVSIAFAASLGGMATPIGSGPNALAIAAAESTQPLSFFTWMCFALPLTIVSTGGIGIFLIWRYRVSGIQPLVAAPSILSVGARRMLVVVVLMVAAWLSEPLHGIPASSVALIGAAALFASGLLPASDLARIDWSTLLLIAGGLVMGRTLEATGCIHTLATTVDWQALSLTMRLGVLIFASAMLSAVMSNTATATVVIPLGLALVPGTPTAVLIALGCSLGAPFVISTPPNAMIHGEGGIRTSDLLWPGLLLLIGGTVALTMTGPWILSQLHVGSPGG